MTEGRYDCPECGESFYLNSMIEGKGALYLQVAHDHSMDPPAWRGVAYPHLKGTRYPKEQKELVAMVKESKRVAREQAKVRKDSR